MILLVGLGNPGPEYALNRHNVGFMALDTIAESYSFSDPRRKGSCLLREGQINDEKVLAVKPLAFMNRSGLAVGEIAKFYKFPPEKMIVIHDDLDVPPGKVRVKQGGGAGGHNGLRSLDLHLGQNYWRLRIGIGHPGSKNLVSGYVLRNFPLEERDGLVNVLQSIAYEIPYLIKFDSETFMNKIALRLQQTS